MNIFPDIVSMLIRARVSFQRVKKFLNMPTVSGLEGLKPLPSHVMQVQERSRDGSSSSIQSSPERSSPIRLKYTLANTTSSVIRQPNILVFRGVTVAWNHATEKVVDDMPTGNSQSSLTKYSSRVWRQSTLSLQQSFRKIYSGNHVNNSSTSNTKMRTPRKQTSVKDDIMEDATAGNIPLNKPSQTLFHAVDSIWKSIVTKPSPTSSQVTKKHQNKKKKTKTNTKSDSRGYSKLDSTPSYDDNDNDEDENEEVKRGDHVELSTAVRNPLFGTPSRNNNSNTKASETFSIYDDEENNDDDDDDDDGDGNMDETSGAKKDAMTNTIVLRDLTFSVPKGCLTVIIGSTGSGKSSLFSALLGECKILSGQIEMVPGSEISLATQSAWIQNASLRDNILFGSEYDPVRYRRVLFACALEADLAQFPDKDLTDIGEKGVNLSGGQQQRVSLARAAYSKSDIILLDDPLSAVDGKCLIKDKIFIIE